MTVLKRVGRLLKADIHGILDCLEEPEAIARQALREMREEIERCEKELKSRQAEVERSAQRIEQIQSDLRSCEEQLELCFEEGNESLAKSIVRKRLEYQRSLKTLQEAQERAQQGSAAKKKQIEDYRQRLQRVEQKLELLVKQERVRKEYFEETIFRDSCESVSEEEVEIAFMKEKRRHHSSQQSEEVVS